MNTERKLVTIRQIDKVLPIYVKATGELARCELVVFDGWKAMVSREDGFKPGDLAIFAETDSVFPDFDERFAFLEKCHYRIKTQKYGSLLDENGEPIRSQGLCLPLSYLPSDVVPALGMDVTDILKVTHAPEADEDEFAGNAEFDPSKSKEKTFLMKIMPKWLNDKLMRFGWYRKMALPKKSFKGFPNEVSKTDEERIQNLGKITEVPTLWTLTEKVDGMSSTYLLKKIKTSFLTRLFKGQQYDFAVCTRNNRLGKQDTSAQWAMAEKYNIKDVLRFFLEHSKEMFGEQFDWICIQGECVGPKIQKNRLKLENNDLLCFNFITPKGRMKSTVGAEMLACHGIKWVPIIATGYSIKGMTCDDLLNLADSEPSRVNKNCLREGIVFRAERDDCDLSFKAVSPKYLLKIGE